LYNVFCRVADDFLASRHSPAGENSGRVRDLERTRFLFSRE
jgi:hypothetical protein